MPGRRPLDVRDDEMIRDLVQRSRDRALIVNLDTISSDPFASVADRKTVESGNAGRYALTNRGSWEQYGKYRLTSGPAQPATAARQGKPPASRVHESRSRGRPHA